MIVCESVSVGAEVFTLMYYTYFSYFSMDLWSVSGVLNYFHITDERKDSDH